MEKYTTMSLHTIDGNAIDWTNIYLHTNTYRHLHGRKEIRYGSLIFFIIRIQWYATIDESKKNRDPHSRK